MKLTPREARLRRHGRIRRKVAGTSQRPRLCVFRSLRHIYAQIIDDTQGHTLASASTLDGQLGGGNGARAKTESARLVGALLAQRALARGVQQVVFDRGGYRYHGRLKALAEAARQEGLQF